MFTFCSLSKETFKIPQDNNLQIKKDGWREVHFGIMNFNARENYTLGVKFTRFCFTPTSSKTSFLELHEAAYCPEHVQNRDGNVTCQQLIVFVQGVEVVDEEIIGLCIQIPVNDTPTEFADNLEFQAQNYTVKVLGKLLMDVSVAVPYYITRVKKN